MRQITVMHGPERRRRWTDEERLRILAEAATPGACVADVARRHDISMARICLLNAKVIVRFGADLPNIWHAALYFGFAPRYRLCGP